MSPAFTIQEPDERQKLDGHGELIFETTSTTAWFATHDVPKQLATLLTSRELCSSACAWRLRLVMHELLRNAIEHGNLKIPSGSKRQSLAHTGNYYKTVESAIATSPDTSKLITVMLWQNGSILTGLVQDSGSGFTPGVVTGIGQKLLHGLTRNMFYINNGSGTIFTVEDKNASDIS